ELAGREADAEHLYGKVLREHPDQHHALHQLALIHRGRGDLARALELLAAAMRADRFSDQALSNHGLVLQELGRHTEAVASFDRALVIARHNVAALHNRGNSLMALNRVR